MKLKYLIIFILTNIYFKIYAEGDKGGILGGINIQKIKTGDIHTDDIPKIIQFAIDFLMGFAATISIIFIIIGAYKIAFGSLENDKSKGKETIILAISGFILSSVSWLILKLIIDNFS